MTQHQGKGELRIEREKRLTEMIRSAFADVPYPGDDQLVDMSPVGFNFEQKDLLLAFQGRDWRDLTLKNLHNTGQYFFTPEGYRFFLPAYMLVSIMDYEDADVLPESTIGKLAAVGHEASGNDEKSKRTFALFSSAQREAIREFARFLEEEHGEDWSHYRKEFDRIMKFYI